MSLKDLYLKPGFVTGVVLVLLGAGNWIIGSVQVNHYRAVVAAGSDSGTEGGYGGVGTRAPQGNRVILGRIHEEREQYDAAKVKMDFFYVVLTGGLILFLAGLALACFALFRSSAIARSAESRN
ncbi:MAG: hypothetical protein OXF11_00125 [Deltaproteobacteria bacterium]|nr:hypothetical protein [Deltaproteobacteria bacterium]